MCGPFGVCCVLLCVACVSVLVCVTRVVETCLKLMREAKKGGNVVEGQWIFCDTACSLSMHPQRTIALSKMNKKDEIN